MQLMITQVTSSISPGGEGRVTVGALSSQAPGSSPEEMIPLIKTLRNAKYLFVPFCLNLRKTKQFVPKA